MHLPGWARSAMPNQTATRRGREGFDGRSYWETRLRSESGLRATGHRRFSEAYNHAMYQVATDHMVAALRSAGVELAGKRILDIGPGFGYFVERYLEWGAEHVTGIELTEIGVTRLRQRFPHQEFVRADISEMDRAWLGQFDVVSAISVVFHIVGDEAFDRALRNICAAVKRGGHLVIVDRFNGLSLPTARHARYRNMRYYEPILREQGFSVLSVRPMYYVLSRSVVPLVGPWLLSWEPVLRLLLRLEHYCGRRLGSNLGGLKFLIAQQQGPPRGADRPGRSLRRQAY